MTFSFMARFSRAYPDDLPANAEATFARMVIDALVEAGMPRGRMAREQALAANVCRHGLLFGALPRSMELTDESA